MPDHTTLTSVAGTTATGWMLQHTMDRLRAWGGPYVVENVDGARKLMPGAMLLCGSMFDLTDGGWLLRRHRLFDSNMPLWSPGPCACRGRKVIGVYGDLSKGDRPCSGRRTTRPNGDMRAGVDRARRLMGMPWAGPEGLVLAVPPAYTRFIGAQIAESLTQQGRLTGRPA